MPGMTTHAGHSHALTDPITLALTNLASADHHGEAARNLRDAGEHSNAGKRREDERLCLKRAEILAGLAQAQHLSDLAESLNRIALAQ